MFVSCDCWSWLTAALVQKLSYQGVRLLAKGQLQGTRRGHRDICRYEIEKKYWDWFQGKETSGWYLHYHRRQCSVPAEYEIKIVITGRRPWVAPWSRQPFMGPWELISKLMSLSLPDNHLPDSDTGIVTQVVGGGKKAFVRNAENSQQWGWFVGLKILMWSVLSCA